MHDPKTVAFEIRYPWPKYPRAVRKAQPDSFAARYRESFITVWHVDPELDGTDDSCGWFIRRRHLDQKVLSNIVREFGRDWDRTFKSDSSGITYSRGLFHPRGQPNLSVHGITLNLFFLAAREVLGGRDLAMRFMSANLCEILLFAENPSDSLDDMIRQTFGPAPRSERITELACIIHSWIARETRRWWRHPRWHIRHWEIQVHPWQDLRRWLLTRCCRCGKRFGYGESPVSSSWDSPPLRWFRGEVGLYHMDCSRPGASNAACATQPTTTDVH